MIYAFDAQYIASSMTFTHADDGNGTPSLTIVYVRAPAAPPTTTVEEATRAFASEVRDHLAAPINPGMTRSAWHRERAAPLGCARSQECRPFVPRAAVERRHRSSLRRFLAA